MLTTADWREAFPELARIQLGPEAAVARRAVEGGTAVEAVRRQIAQLAAHLADEWKPRARLAE
jgi:argininosuccinate lyase